MSETNSTPPAIDRDSWAHRRTRLDVFYALFAIWITYILWRDNPDQLYVSAVFYLIMGMVSLLGAYIFGSVWDYKSYLDAVAPRRDHV